MAHPTADQSACVLRRLLKQTESGYRGRKRTMTSVVLIFQKKNVVDQVKYCNLQYQMRHSDLVTLVRQVTDRAKVLECYF